MNASGNVADHAVRRREATLAGHRGDGERARAYLRDPHPTVRASALGALARAGCLTTADVSVAVNDAEPAVRRFACEVAGRWAGPGAVGLVLAATGDEHASVVEAAAAALGELGNRRAVSKLIVVATEHRDPLCREAAVAALGAIGDRRGLPAILTALNDKPAVRRRAVIALAPFDGPEVDGALERALADRDWQVRQAAEDLSGRCP
jgi:HEAT repeat protein